ncbi:MAG: hypothetical protein A2Z38_02165 [Planctomycetes bacterium RBG_19FT_COMBO_48_8]|nr:MAG: hypothetical protein A2Z38_02165 [Planctomycetes bacterium RBG_19FT_COMBO_48_8]
MDAVLYIIAGPLFLISIAAHFYVKLRLRPKQDADSEDDYYYEFEDQQPDVARYLLWSRLTFAAATIGVLLLFIAAVI